MSTPIPETVKHGFVQGRIVLSVGDDSDEDQLPNAVPAVGAVSFTALNRITREYEAVPPTTVVGTRVTRALNENGVLVNTDGTPGIWLSVGPHKVAYLLDDVEIPRHDIEVTELHTPDNPLDLTEAIPPGGPVLTPTEYADLMSKFTTLETRVVASVAAPATQASIDAASASASATSAYSSAISALNSANSADADRIAAEASKRVAQDAEESAVLAKTAAEAASATSIAARDISVSAKDTSVAAKDDAVIAKTAAETAATNAQQAVTVHESAADPHTQYHTNARGDARYAAPTGTDDRLQVNSVDVTPAQVGAATAEQGAKADLVHAATPILTNLVQNGDFSDGTTGWSIAASLNAEVIDDYLRIIGNGTSASQTIYPSFTANSGHVYYKSFEYRIEPSDNFNNINFYSGGASLYGGADTGEWQRISIRYTTTSNGSYITAGFSSTIAASTTYTDIRRVVVLDLTSIFGEGREPATAQEVDFILETISDTLFVSENAIALDASQAVLNSYRKTWKLASSYKAEGIVLRSPNVTVDIETNAFSCASHGLVDGDAVSIYIEEYINDAAPKCGLSTGTKMYVINSTADTFQLADYNGVLHIFTSAGISKSWSIREIVNGNVGFSGFSSKRAVLRGFIHRVGTGNLQFRTYIDGEYFILYSSNPTNALRNQGIVNYDVAGNDGVASIYRTSTFWCMSDAGIATTYNETGGHYQEFKPSTNGNVNSIYLYGEYAAGTRFELWAL